MYHMPERFDGNWWLSQVNIAHRPASNALLGNVKHLILIPLKDTNPSNNEWLYIVGSLREWPIVGFELV